MSEREQITKWIRLYITELDQLVAVSTGPQATAAMSEVHAARTILRTIETGEYLLDLTAAPGSSVARGN